jgi:ankyrin repeat protein
MEILELSHPHGADLDAGEGQPLFNAVMGEHLGGVKFLVLSGADVNARMGISITLAVRNGDAEIVEFLIAYGARLATPSQIADAAQCDSLETLLLLQNHGYQLHPFADEVVAEAAKSATPRLLKYVLEHKPGFFRRGWGWRRPRRSLSESML